MKKNNSYEKSKHFVGFSNYDKPLLYRTDKDKYFTREAITGWSTDSVYNCFSVSMLKMAYKIKTMWSIGDGMDIKDQNENWPHALLLAVAMAVPVAGMANGLRSQEP